MSNGNKDPENNHQKEKNAAKSTSPSKKRLNEIWDLVKRVYIDQRKATAKTIVIGFIAIAISLFGIIKIPDYIKSRKFDVFIKYFPTMMIGDIDDFEIIKGEKIHRFIYKPTGNGRHEWIYKYADSRLTEPSRFAGVYYVYPSDNNGTDPDGGYNLIKYNRIEWEARSTGEEVYVEFKVGGIRWIWDEKTKERIIPPYPDTLKEALVGAAKLTNEWQKFCCVLKYSEEYGEDFFRDEFYLSEECKLKINIQSKNNFKRVVGGFAIVIPCNGNGIDRNQLQKGQDPVKTFEIELKNVYYKR